MTVALRCSWSVCQNFVGAAVLIALPGDRAKLLLQLSGCTDAGPALRRSAQRKSRVQVPPWDGCRCPIDTR